MSQSTIRSDLRQALLNESELSIKKMRDDKNNKLNEKQCEQFLLDYDKFKKGEIDYIINPKTNKGKITKYSRIEFLAKNCKKQLELSDSDSENKFSKSPENIKEGYQYIKVELFSIKLLDLATKTKHEKYQFIKTLFTRNFKEKTMIKILDEYINDDSIEHTDETKSIKKIIELIKDNFMSEFSIFMEKKDFFNKLKSKYLDSDEYSDLIIKSNNVLNRIFLYRENNTNETEFFSNIDKKKEILISLNFILRRIYDIINYDYCKIELAKYFLLFNKLLIKDIFIRDTDATPSFEKSPTWTKTPSKSDKLIEYKTNKEEELKRIMNNKLYNGEINDTDFYTMEEFKDMPLSKLKNVIVIPYEENGKKYANAYYVKSLYKAWYIAKKENKDFINPANRKPFTDDDKNTIMKYINIMFPTLKSPRYGNSGRSDILVKVYFSNEYIRELHQIQRFQFIKVSFIVDDGNSWTDILLYDLVEISYPDTFCTVNDHAMESDDNYVPLNYNPTFLIDMINKLSRENKIVGKTIPFKINDVFKKYNFKKLNKREYMTFFDELRHLI